MVRIEPSCIAAGSRCPRRPKTRRGDPGNEQIPPPRYTVRFAQGTRRARPANWRYRCPQRVPTLASSPSPSSSAPSSRSRGRRRVQRRIETPISPPAPPRWIAEYAFGPSPAREINYRIAWQSSIDGESRGSTSSDDDVFAMDTRNQLTRFDRNTGSRVWTVTGADALDTIWGVTPGVAPPGGRPFGQNDDDKIYITSDPGIFELDYNSGAVVGRQDLERIPSTEVLPLGNHLVFGTRSGQIVWHQFVVGQAWRANQLKGPVVADPTLVGTSDIACASEGGTLLLLDGRSARKLWGDNLFDGVTAAAHRGRRKDLRGQHRPVSLGVRCTNRRRGLAILHREPARRLPDLRRRRRRTGAAVGGDRRSGLPGSESRQRDRRPQRLDHPRRPGRGDRNDPRRRRHLGRGCPHAPTRRRLPGRRSPGPCRTPAGRADLSMHGDTTLRGRRRTDASSASIRSS